MLPGLFPYVPTASDACCPSHLAVIRHAFTAGDIEPWRRQGTDGTFAHLLTTPPTAPHPINSSTSTSRN